MHRYQWVQTDDNFVRILKDSGKGWGIAQSHYAFDISFANKKLVIKIYIFPDKASQHPITISFAFAERRSSIQYVFLYFSSIAKGKKNPEMW